jgi:hypothetical protein
MAGLPTAVFAGHIFHDTKPRSLHWAQYSPLAIAEKAHNFYHVKIHERDIGRLSVPGGVARLRCPPGVRRHLHVPSSRRHCGPHGPQRVHGLPHPLYPAAARTRGPHRRTEVPIQCAGTRGPATQGWVRCAEPDVSVRACCRDESRVSWLDGKGQFGASLEAVRRHLRRTHNKRVLISAINDPSALGALRAFEEAGRGASCVVVGQNASVEGRTELRKPASRFVGSVAYFPERYGPAVIGLCLDILDAKPVPPAMFVKHELVTRDNVNRLYANDAVLAPGELDALLSR